jgi:hypothetical protein
MDVSTKFYKIFNTNESPFGMEINNLRHVVTPTISYNYIAPPTMPKEKVYGFDDIDTLDRKNIVTLSLENRLQTKRGKDLHNVDMATLLIETDYNFKHTPGTQFEDYKTKLELHPYDWVTATSNSTIDSHKRYHHEWLKEITNDIFINPTDKWSVGLGHRYTREAQNILAQAKLANIVPGWAVSIYEDFDFKGYSHGEKRIHQLREQEYVLTKSLHCWEMDIRYNVERGEGETIMVIFRLKAFPEIPFEFGRSYHKPKFGSQSYQESSSN